MSQKSHPTHSANPSPETHQTIPPHPGTRSASCILLLSLCRHLFKKKTVGQKSSDSWDIPSGKHFKKTMENHHVQWEYSTISTGPFSMSLF